MCSRKMSHIPIVIVLGATGTGKSKLAIRIAKKFNGEIISADSMQVYEGLDVTSNKVTRAERAEVPHHMLNVCKPTDRFTVLDFRNRTLRIIEEITKRRKLPIIVGGTGYYIESILWNMLLQPPEDGSQLCWDRPRGVLNGNAAAATTAAKTSDKLNRQELYTGDIANANACEAVSAEVTNDETDSISATTVAATVTTTTTTVTLSRVNHLLDEIERLKSDFEESVRNIVAHLNISQALYSRTFYSTTEDAASLQTGGGDEQLSLPTSDDEFGVLVPLDTAVHKLDIIDVETTIMRAFIGRCLEHAITSLHAKWTSPSSEELRRDCSADVAVEKKEEAPTSMSTALPDFSEFYSAKIALAAVAESEKWTKASGGRIGVHRQGSYHEDVYKSRSVVRRYADNMRRYADGMRQYVDSIGQRKDTLSACGRMLQAILEHVSRAAEMRIMRLRLVRIVDDTDLTDFSSEQVYSQLRLLDLPTAKNMHPNNRRKIIRAVQVFMQTGKTYSQLVDEQHRADGTDAHGLSLRFPDALLLWLRCDQEVLNERLCKRVEEMLQNGLIDELEQFHERYNLERSMASERPDYTKGIFQSIGLKQFHSFLVLSDEEKRSVAGKKQKTRAVHLLKQAHCQYSRIQNRFLTNKLIKVPDSKQIPLIFELDCTEVEKWCEHVESKALALVDLYVKNDVDLRSFSPISRQPANLDRFEGGEHFCDVCQRMFIGQYQWQAHYTSKLHRRCLYNSKVKKLQQKIATLGRPRREVFDDDDDFDLVAGLFD